MIPFAIEVRHPRSLEETVSDLALEPAASRVLGGGTWLVPELNRGAPACRHVIDIRRAGLAAISVEGDRLVLGSAATYAALAASPDIRRFFPEMVALAQGVTGGPQIVHRGTIGGSACAARPASDVPGLFAMLEADVALESAAGPRVLPAVDFWRGPSRTAARDDELVVAFRLAFRPPGPSAYLKLKHSGSSPPIVTASARAEIGPEGVTAMRVGLGAAAGRPWAWDATELVPQRTPTPEAALEIGSTLAAEVADYVSDELAPAGYRRRAAAVAIARTIAQCYVPPSQYPEDIP